MTQKLGIIGWPARHSLSPKIHRYWFREHAIEATYEVLETPEDALEIELAALRKNGFHGANITVPHKEKTLALVDEVDDVARRIGAVNTILVRESQKLFGTNTDAYGFMESVRQSSGNIERPVVLGAGGAARAIVAALSDAGAKEILLLNRTQEKAEAIAKQWSLVKTCAWEKRSGALKEATILVNTTSLGMEGKDKLDLSLTELPEDALVMDIVYAPLLTQLLKAAKKRGNPTADGIGMLLYQAQAAFRLWFGITPRVTEDLRNAIVSGV